MDLTQPRFRINASMMPDFVGKGVVLLGLPHSVDPNGAQFMVKATDDKDVRITMAEPLQELVDGLIEIHGVVEQDSIQCHNYVLFAPEMAANFDIASYNQAVELMQRIPEHYLQGVPVQE